MMNMFGKYIAALPPFKEYWDKLGALIQEETNESNSGRVWCNGDAV